MPFLSIIVVTWNNENFIEQALASCIDTGLSNYEVIVVHNASDDRTGELIQRSIAGYEHIFRVVENERNEGLGKARNIGVQYALGDYFIFLDGDDWFEPQAIAQLINKLQENNPDVLLYDYQRVWDTGWKKTNQLSHLLYEHDASSPNERRAILSVFNIACNKAYRKFFIDEHRIQFSDGYYEDVGWTYEIMLKAESVYVVPTIVLNYRQREGSILRSTDERHVILPERYDYLWSVLIERSDLVDAYGKQLYELVRKHLFSRIIWPRLPYMHRAKYLRKTAEVMDKWRALVGVTRRDSTLVVARLGSPLLYSAGKSGARLVSYLRKKTKTRKGKIYNFCYKELFCRLPIRSERAYIESYWGEKFDGNPISLADGLKKLGDYQVFVGVRRGVKVPAHFDFPIVRMGSLRYWYVVATSRLLISDANLNGLVRKRKNAIHVQAKHGTPLKHMGLDNRGKPLHSLNWATFAGRCRRWDYVISSNPYSSEIWRRAFPYNYKVLELGYPRNDILFSLDPAVPKKIRETVGVPAGKKVALYAPTFRDHDRGERFCPGLSLTDMQKSLGDDYVLLVRSHSFSKSSLDVEKEPLASIIDVSGYVSSSELCLISDLLITDYSSIMFDYACLKRPIVLLHYDYARYVQERGVYFDIQKEPPGVVVETVGELLDVLASKSYESDENNLKLRKFNSRFCPWDDGTATEKVLKAVLN